MPAAENSVHSSRYPRFFHEVSLLLVLATLVCLVPACGSASLSISDATAQAANVAIILTSNFGGNPAPGVCEPNLSPFDLTPDQQANVTFCRTGKVQVLATTGRFVSASGCFAPGAGTGQGPLADLCKTSQSSESTLSASDWVAVKKRILATDPLHIASARCGTPGVQC